MKAGVYHFSNEVGYHLEHQVREDGWHRIFSLDLMYGMVEGPWTSPVERAYLAHHESGKMVMRFYATVEPHQFMEKFRGGTEKELELHGEKQDLIVKWGDHMKDMIKTPEEYKESVG